jgi:hypothetical protein
MKTNIFTKEELKFNSLLNILLKMDEKRQERNLEKFIEKKVDEKLKQKLKEFNLIDNNSQILLTAKQAMERYNFGRSKLERAIKDGGLKFSSKHAGCTRLFKQKDLDAFFNNTINFKR